MLSVVAPPGDHRLPAPVYELVRVMVAGAHAVKALGVIVGAAGVGFTAIVTLEDVAGLPEAHVKLDVMIT